MKILVPLCALVLLAPDARAQCGALLFQYDRCTVIDSNNDFDLGSAMTLEAWVRPGSLSLSTAGGAFVGGRSAVAGVSWSLGTNLDDAQDGALYVSAPNTSRVLAPGGYQLGTWRHFAGTYDGQLMNIYVDGVLVATQAHSAGGPSLDAVSVIIGQNPRLVWNKYFIGAMDEVRIWNVVRTPSEIQQTYMMPLSGNEPGLVGYYKFDEGSGDVILDSSTAGNDGYLGLAPGPDDRDPTRIPSGLPFPTCFIGTSYCGPAVQNSSGLPGEITATGTNVASANDVTLLVQNLPPNQFGYFLNSQTQAMVWPVPNSQGVLCVGGAIGRYNANVFNSGSAGEGALTLDLTSTPTPTGSVAIQAGETWNFTCWFRDDNPGPTSNFTDGVSLVFQ